MSKTGVQLAQVEPATALYESVQALGDSQRQWVGLLPHSAWQEYASDGRILAAIAGEVENHEAVLGYVAFRLPRDEVVIAHLVVHESARGRGIARALVDHVRTEHAGRRGVRVRCRRDYPVAGVWPRLGFVARGDRPGRGAADVRLTDWWLDNGHDDLMTWNGGDGDVLPVVIDNNVFLDLHDGRGATAQQTTDILTGTLDGRIEILVTPEIHNEIDRSPDEAHRAHLHSVVEQYPSFAVEPGRVDAVYDEIVGRLPAKPTREQTKSDIRHIAYAACAGVSVVVTRDDNAVNQLGPVVREVTGVRVTTPGSLVLLVDEFESAPSYWPAALLGTGYTMAEATAEDVDELQRIFLASASGERRRGFRRTLDDLAANRPQSTLMVYRDPAGSPVALIGAQPDGADLTVPVLRVRPGALASSLASQAVAQLRIAARGAGVRSIVITDAMTTLDCTNAAIADGYRRAPDGLRGFTLSGALTHTDLKAQLEALASETTIEVLAPLIHSADRLAETTDGREAAAALEHELRPARIVDAPLPTWLVPIKPNWSSHLFGAPDLLGDRPDHLGMSVEHVYYRTNNSAGENAPGRVLWYVSDPEQRIVGCSSLVEVRVGTANELWAAFRRLGVYTRADVQNASGPHGVRALRVSDTQLFQQSVSLARLKELSASLGGSVFTAASTRLSPQLAGLVLREALDAS